MDGLGCLLPDCVQACNKGQASYPKWALNAAFTLVSVVIKFNFTHSFGNLSLHFPQSKFMPKLAFVLIIDVLQHEGM